MWVELRKASTGWIVYRHDTMLVNDRPMGEHLVATKLGKPCGTEAKALATIRTFMQEESGQ